jgi:hypothetical protein
MALKDDEIKKLEAVLLALDGVELKGRSEQFVTDQRARYGQYGTNMLLSLKQWEWLKNLYEEHVGKWDEI